MDDDTDDITVERRLEWWLAEGWEVRLYPHEASRSGRGPVAIELVGYGPGSGGSRGELTPSPYGVGDTLAEAVRDLLERMRPHRGE